MNTATFAGRKTRSAVRRRSGSGLAATRYRRPLACTSRRMSRSGCVSRLRIACMFLLRAAEEAHDPSGGVQSAGSGTGVTPESLAWHFNSRFPAAGRVDRPEANVGYRLSCCAGGWDECRRQYHLGRIDPAGRDEICWITKIRVDYRVQQHGSAAWLIELRCEWVVFAQWAKARDPFSGLSVGHTRDTIEHAARVSFALYECDGLAAEDAGCNACWSRRLGKNQSPVIGSAAGVGRIAEIGQVRSEEIWPAPGKVAHDPKQLGVAED